MELVHAHKGPEVELVRRFAQMGDLLLVLFPDAKLFFIAAVFLLHKEAVVAVIKLRPAVDELNGALHHGVQKPAVVGDGEDGALEVEEVVLQPLGGVHIQMVGGLVQQENVRVLQNEPGQIHPGLFSAGKGGEKLCAHVRRDVKTVGHPVSLPLGLVAAHVFKALHQPVIFHEGAFVTRGHGLFQLFHLRPDLVQTPVGGLQHILHGVALGVAGNLRDETQSHSLSDGDVAAVLRDLAHKDAEQRGLAGAVFAEDAHALAPLNLKAQTVEDVFVHFKGLGQTLYRDVYHSL